MKKTFRLLAVLITLAFAVSTATAQIRIPETPKFERKARQKKQKRFLLQIEPAITSPADYNTTLLGANLNILAVILNQPVSSDQKAKVEGRLRFTTGFWRFSRDFDFFDWNRVYVGKETAATNWVPFEAGFDLGGALELSNGQAIIPYVGFQYGIGFHIGKEEDSCLTVGHDNVTDWMYTFRFGVDYAVTDGIRVGVSYIMNRILIEYKNRYWHYQAGLKDDLKYNQIAFDVSIFL